MGIFIQVTLNFHCSYFFLHQCRQNFQKILCLSSYSTFVISPQFSSSIPKWLTFLHSSKFTLSTLKKSHFTLEIFSYPTSVYSLFWYYSWNPCNRIPSHYESSPFPLLYSLMNLLQDLTQKEQKDMIWSIKKGQSKFLV